MLLEIGQHQGSRAPHGARGLKLLKMAETSERNGRAPHGARGLKLHAHGVRISERTSRPARGAWIETSQLIDQYIESSVAPRTGRVD